MLSKLKKIYNLLNPEHKKEIFNIQIIVILTSILEVASVVMMSPFISMLINANNLEKTKFFLTINNFYSFNNYINFLIVSGIFVLLVLALTSFLSIITMKKIYITSTKIGTDIGADLYKHYISQPWDFHIVKNSSQLTNNITQESLRLTVAIIIPALNMNSKVITAFFLCSALIIYSPQVSAIVIFIYIFCYFCIFIFIKKKLDKFSSIVGARQANRFKLMAEGFGGIKDILLSRTQQIFKKNFQEASDDFAHALGTSQYLSVIPRYAMELVAFGSVIIIILIMLIYYNENLISILPLLAVFLLAGFKLIPCFQQIYSNAVSIRANLSAFNSVEQDLQLIFKLNNGNLNKVELKNSLEKKNKISREYYSQKYFIFLPQQ